MKLYIVNKIWTSSYELEEHSSEVFFDKNKAIDYCHEQEKEWLESKKESMDKDAFEEWEVDSLQLDVDNPSAIYKHYVYDEGTEKVFEMTELEISDANVYVVKEDYRYMNNQCEIGSEVHLITNDLQKAYAKAMEIKAGILQRFDVRNSEEYEKMDEEGYDYYIQDEFDTVSISILKHEIE